MSDLRKAAQDLLQAWDLPFGFHPAQARFNALRAALAQPDPVEVRRGWEYMREKGLLHPKPEPWMGVTDPPKRKPLTDEEIELVCAPLGMYQMIPREVARAIEKAHGIGGEHE
jgi:hypothetical protein